MPAQPQDSIEDVTCLEGRIAQLEVEIDKSQRSRRRSSGIILLSFLALLLLAQVTVKNGNFEIHENPDGGAAGSDSYELRIIGRVVGPADRAMILQNIAEVATDDYRLAILNNGGVTEIMTLDDDGNVGIGSTSPSLALHVDSGVAGTTGVLMLESNDGDFRFFVTGNDPESVITGNPGDLAVDQANGAIYIKDSGAGNTGWAWLGPRQPFFAYDAAGNQTIDGTEFTLNIDTVGVSDANYSLAADVITFNADGVYKITVDVGCEETNNSGGNRNSIEVTVQEDTGGGFTDISYVVAGTYTRESADRFSTSQTWLRSFNSGDDIRVRVIRDSGTMNIDTRANLSRITIERVK